MNILIYSPYLHILGGGEQYLFNFAQCLAKKHRVFLVCPDVSLLTRARQRFNVDTSAIVPLPFFPPRLRLKNYQATLVVSDGSMPFLPFTKSILLLMSPFSSISWLDRLKLKFIDRVVCFSSFTKQYIDKAFRVDSRLIYPGIQTTPFKLAKTNLLLSVGRFSQTMHSKNHLILLNTFIELEPHLPGWRLVVAGGTEPGSDNLLKQLQRTAKGHNVSILPDISRRRLYRLYAQAKLYWHAAGFAVNLKQTPQKAEHFGIAVVEAMSYATVPLVFAAGGPQEIVVPGSGFLWDNLPQLKKLTLTLAKDDQKRRLIGLAARRRARTFNLASFCRNIYELVEN